MKKVFSLLFSLLIFTAYSQQTISDWKYQKDMSSNPQNFIKAGKKVYFIASNPEHGKELWVTEGTTESTTMVKDIMVGENSAFGYSEYYAGSTYNSFPSNFAPLEDGTLYFVASDNPNEKPKIWVTDGTEKGTKIYQNEVKGSLFYTGDELVEYNISNFGKMVLYRKANKIDTINVASRVIPILKGGSTITFGAYGSETPERYFSMISIDMKEAKVKVKTPTLYFQSGFRNTTLWENDMFATYDNKVFRMNTKTGLLDTLFVGNSKTNLNVQALYPTSKKLFLTVSNKVYEFQNNQFIPLNNSNFDDVLSVEKGIYNEFIVTSYDVKNNVLYSYFYDYKASSLTVKGIRLSDYTIVKNFSIPSFYPISSYTAYSSFRNVSKFTSDKIFVTQYKEPYQTKILDITKEKIVDLPASLYYANYETSDRNFVSIGDTDNRLLGISNSPKNDNNELYFFNGQTEEIKLLKDINSTGISTPKIFTATFNGKLVQVYNNEQGIMLGVSDGTRAGTKDLKLLVKNYNIQSLNRVEFQEFNQRLGVLLLTRNANDDSTDSTFCFTLDRNFATVNRLISEATYINEYNTKNQNIRLSKLYKDRIEIDVYQKKTIIGYSLTPNKYITDFTTQNLSLIGFDKSTILANDNFSLVFGTVFGTYLYQNRRYLAKYDLKTQKVDTISNSIAQSYTGFNTSYVVDNKVYFKPENTEKWYGTDGISTQEIIGLKTITNSFKMNGKTLFIENYYVNNVGNQNNSVEYSILQIENNKVKRLFSKTSVVPYYKSYSEKIWEFNGKTYLILDIVPPYPSNKYLTQFYEISSDFTFTKVFEIEDELLSSVQFLSKGLVYSRSNDRNHVITVMDDTFQPKVVYQSKIKERFGYEKLTDYVSKKYFAFSSGNMFVTDGSVEGSKLLVENNIEDGIFYTFSSKYLIDNNPDKFFFSFFPANVHGINLWITDGTKNGTVQLINQKTNTDRDLVYANELLGKIGNKYLFRKPNENTLRYEVWTTEGTVSTTQKLKDMSGDILFQPILSYYDSKSWQNLPKINNKLYFSRQTEKNGYEPWETDGTPEGTKMMGDLVKGIQSSNPYQFVEINQTPYCIATEENKSLQLWSFCNPKVSINVEKISQVYIEEVKLLATQNNEWKYQWLKDGKALDKANETSYAANSSGTYQIKVEDKIGCTNTSDSIVINFAKKILANEEMSDEFNVKIFPNPSQNDINLIFEGRGRDSFQLSVYDLSGRLLINQDVKASVLNTISTQNLNAGAYFMRLSNGEKQSITKVIKY